MYIVRMIHLNCDVLEPTESQVTQYIVLTHPIAEGFCAAAEWL